MAGMGELGNLWVTTNHGTGYRGASKRFGVSSAVTHLRQVTA